MKTIEISFSNVQAIVAWLCTGGVKFTYEHKFGCDYITVDANKELTITALNATLNAVR